MVTAPLALLMARPLLDADEEAAEGPNPTTLGSMRHLLLFRRWTSSMVAKAPLRLLGLSLRPRRQRRQQSSNKKPKDAPPSPTMPSSTKDPPPHSTALTTESLMRPAGQPKPELSSSQKVSYFRSADGRAVSGCIGTCAVMRGVAHNSHEYREAMAARGVQSAPSGICLDES